MGGGGQGDPHQYSRSIRSKRHLTVEEDKLEQSLQERAYRRIYSDFFFSSLSPMQKMRVTGGCILNEVRERMSSDKFQHPLILLYVFYKWIGT